MTNLCLKVAVVSIVALITVTVLTLRYLYEVKTDGTLYLKNAHGEATITREKDTNIPHIRGDSWLSTVYA